ncbi:hypothetical protein CU669_20675 [Paramagnetospirillum kuznetsovii]|uniref:Uncharacterized protein n=1 Tax=Paramagnetospirillum kuznetsovii TaxID=2053833 RepID=A0A364NSD1_9PROT|nr:hypothetical protein CU669_20675 [Paramagnetospirillum kuznetsovii]
MALGSGRGSDLIAPVGGPGLIGHDSDEGGRQVRGSLLDGGQLVDAAALFLILGLPRLAGLQRLPSWLR